MPKGAHATPGDMLFFLSTRIKCVKTVLIKLFFVESFFFFFSLMFIRIHCYAEVCIWQFLDE